MRMWRLAWGVALIGALTAGALADEPVAEPTPKERFLEAYVLLTKADRARDAEDWAPAAAGYDQALALYQGIANDYPDWQREIIAYRLAYCANQRQLAVERGGVDLEAARSSAAAASVEALRAAKRKKPRRGLLGALGFRSHDERVATALTSAQREDLRRIASDAGDRLRHGQSREALALLTDGRRLDPTSRPLILLHGAALCQVGDFKQAADVLKDYVKSSPEDSEARCALSAAYMGLGQTSGAMDELEQALKINPENGVAHYNYAQILLSVRPRERETARRHYLQALRLGAAKDEYFEQLLDR